METVLTFHLQEDGRRVARLPSGKIVLLAFDDWPRVKDGESWRVRLEDRGTFEIARAVQAEAAPAPAVAEPRAAARDGAGTVRPQPTPFPALARGEALPEPSDVLAREDRVALFVDSANVQGATRSLGFFVDWRRAKDYFTEDARFYGAFFYVGVEAEDAAQVSFLDFLTHAGYIVRTKPVKRIVDRETGEERYKANLDVEVALDMMDTLGNWDVAFLFSGDGDFARAVEMLRSRGKRVYVVAPSAALARELAYVADKPIFFLDNYRSVVAREDRRPLA